MSTALILNIAFSAVVFAVVVGRIALAIANQHDDRGVTLVSRQRGHRLAFRRAAQPRPQPARGSRGRPWPAA
jgi:hypothetical protein